MPPQRPTLPARCQASTIGPEGLNGRIRNGNGCFPFGMATEANQMKPKLVEPFDFTQGKLREHKFEAEFDP